MYTGILLNAAEPHLISFTLHRVIMLAVNMKTWVLLTLCILKCIAFFDSEDPLINALEEYEYFEQFKLTVPDTTR